MSLVGQNENKAYNAQGKPYCTVCGEPLERWDDGLRKSLPRSCSCQIKRRNEREAKEKQQKLDLERDKCFYRKRVMFDHTFDNSDGSQKTAEKLAKKYCEDFRQYLYGTKHPELKGKGLLFYGGVGTGKSYVAACIANEIINQGFKVRYVSFSDIASKMQSDFAKAQDVLDDMEEVSLVVFDDLGAERKTEWMQGLVFQLIEIRLNSGKPMIITTNLTLEELSGSDSITQERIYDRIWESMLDVIPVKGGSKRKDSFKDRRKAFREGALADGQ